MVIACHPPKHLLACRDGLSIGLLPEPCSTLNRGRRQVHAREDEKRRLETQILQDRADFTSQVRRFAESQVSQHAESERQRWQPRLEPQTQPPARNQEFQTHNLTPLN